MDGFKLNYSFCTERGEKTRSFLLSFFVTIFSKEESKMYNPYSFQNPFQANQLLKVNGIEGARAYQMAGPNSTVALFDVNEDIFYIKTSDASGFASINAYKFTPYKPKAEYEASGELENYVTREEFNKLKEIIENVQLTVSESVKSTEHIQPAQSVPADSSRERPKRYS